MRYGFVVLLLLVIGVPPTLAQPTPAEPVALKYWIFFTDKPTDAAKVPSVTVTDEALDRRAMRASQEASWYDQPVAPFYVTKLHEMSVVPLVQSRWLNAVSAMLTPAQATQIQALPFVTSVRLVGKQVHPDVSPALAPPSASGAFKTTTLDYGPSQTQLEQINAINPLEAGINGAGVIFGILDTEFGAFTHPVFAHIYEDNRFLGYFNFAEGSQSNRHGLSVASVAIGFAEGQLIGPAHGAQLLAATTEFAPTETNQEEDNLVAGLEWMEAQGADVVNISLGYTEFDAGQNSYTYEDLDGNTAITTQAVDIAVGLGMVVVTSAGNEGSSAWHFIGTPADAHEVISVGGVQANGVRSSFSSFGPTADGRIKPEVSAMGSSVRVAGTSGYGFLNGTSFSSPLVAGVVCQILQVNPTLTPAEVRELLKNTASQATTPDNSLGWGIVNAGAAIAAAETATHREASDLPQSLSVAPPYPNPFSHHTTFELTGSAQATPVHLRIYNLLGQEVAVPFEGPLSPGQQRITFDATGLSPGVYVYQLTGEGVMRSGKMVVMR